MGSSTHWEPRGVKAGGGRGEKKTGSGQQTALTQHSHTQWASLGLGTKQVFNKPLVDESTNRWTECE